MRSTSKIILSGTLQLLLDIMPQQLTITCMEYA